MGRVSTRREKVSKHNDGWAILKEEKNARDLFQIAFGNV